MQNDYHNNKIWVRRRTRSRGIVLCSLLKKNGTRPRAANRNQTHGANWPTNCIDFGTMRPNHREFCTEIKSDDRHRGEQMCVRTLRHMTHADAKTETIKIRMRTDCAFCNRREEMESNWMDASPPLVMSVHNAHTRDKDRLFCAKNFRFLVSFSIRHIVSWMCSPFDLAHLGNATYVWPTDQNDMKITQMPQWLFDDA